MRIDLNCDLGEGCSHDAALLALITSASVSCGAHAGTPAQILETLRWAREAGVQIGAHPSFPDREHFGRRELACSAEQVFCDCIYQIGALAGLAQAVGCTLRYVKPHGALYNQAARDAEMARPVVAAARQFGLAVMGLPGSCLQREAHAHRLRFICEGFADRRHLPDGGLVPRGRDEAFIHDPQAAVEQVAWLIQERGVETICVHGDNPHAVVFVQRLRDYLIERGAEVRAFDV